MKILYGSKALATYLCFLVTLLIINPALFVVFILCIASILTLLTIGMIFVQFDDGPEKAGGKFGVLLGKTIESCLLHWLLFGVVWTALWLTLRW